MFAWVPTFVGMTLLTDAFVCKPPSSHWRPERGMRGADADIKATVGA
ncbi:MAG: hypothetical protein QM780_03340 [Hyphomicrobium sp.]